MLSDDKPLKIIAIGDYTTRTGLGTAMNIPLRKLKAKGIIEPVVLGTGFDGWNIFLPDEFESFPILPMINSYKVKPDGFGRDCLHIAISKYEEKFSSYVDVVLICQDVQNQLYVAFPELALERGEVNEHALSILKKRNRVFRHVAYFPIDGLCKDETFHHNIATINIERPINPSISPAGRIMRGTWCARNCQRRKTNAVSLTMTM